MPVLVLEFASNKAYLSETRDRILAVVKRCVDLDMNSRIPRPEQIGLFPGEPGAAVFTYRWRLPLQGRVENGTIEDLEAGLSGLQVHRVYVEESACRMLEEPSGGSSAERISFLYHFSARCSQSSSCW